MKSRFSRISGRGRGGHTLLELLIAMGLGLVVSGIALYAYVNADKAKSVAITSNMLKVAGQRSLEGVFKKLNQSRRVYERDAVTDAFLARLPITGFDASAGALSPGLPATPSDDLVMPLGKAEGSFLAQLDDGTGVPAAGTNPDFDQASVGNALFFMTKEPHVAVTEATAGVQATAFQSQTYRLNAYRVHFYFQGRRDLGLRPAVRPGSAFLYELMHWESALYLDKRDVESWMVGLTSANGAGAQTFITTKLAALRAAGTGIAGAIDRGATDPDDAFLKLETTDYATLLPMPAGTQYATGRFATAMPTGLQSSIGDAFVAFNTVAPTSAAYPAVALKAFSAASAAEPTNVPGFADGAASAKPYGFEVMIAGPPSARRVLLRLALAARPSGRNTIMGEVYQQVVQVYDN